MYNARIVGVFMTCRKGGDRDKATSKTFAQITPIKPAKEPSTYIWENMRYSILRRSIAFVLTMGFMALVIFFAYRLQFFFQKSVSYFDNYEQIDC